MLKITPSLYSAWNSYIEGWSSIDDFVKALEKVPTPPTEAMQKGVEFENAVYACMNSGTPSNDPKVSEAAERCKGGYIQVRCEKKLTDNVIVYGVADVVLPDQDKVIDIKRSASYSLGKYENSIQHLVYMYALELNNFEYLVADNASIYTEYYHWSDNAAGVLLSRVNQCIDFICEHECFKKPFLEKWSIE